MNIKKGEQFVCIKDVRINDTKDIESFKVAYKEGQLYRSEENGCITDNQKCTDHHWTSLANEHFVKIEPRVFKKGDIVMGTYENNWAAVVIDTDRDRLLLAQLHALDITSSYDSKDFVVVGSLGYKEDEEYNPLDEQVGGTHYNKDRVQPIEYATQWEFTPSQVLTLRYLTRHREKNGAEDIAKGIHSMHLLLKLEYNTTYEKITKCK